jgi:hypothetical protein
LAALLHFLLYPPSETIFTKSLKDFGVREMFLTFYSITAIICPLSIHLIPFIMVLVSFVRHWPLGPGPSDNLFGILQFAFIIHIFLFHLPRTPSPLFLLPLDHSLPLATLLSYGMSLIFLPIIMYFLPVLIFTAFILSLSLADTFLHAVALVTPPIEVRTGFLALLILVILVLMASSVILIAMFPSLSHSNMASASWDIYSQPIGLGARKTFVRAIVKYSPYIFPPPFNAFQLLFVQLPLAILRLVGAQDWIVYVLAVEKSLWMVLVGLPSMFIGSLWSWSEWMIK